jgi:pyruvate/2-oxoglutarate dehydrogenase complex dihydrolipoamide dehydrogenase (E3) component
LNYWRAERELLNDYTRNVMTDFVSLLPMDSHNEQLEANVHPPDWVKPTPTGSYNLVVIGAGTAGLVTAAGLGAKVALIERELMGGDCLNVGCVPSKAIIRAARVAAQVQVRDAGEFGVRGPEGVRVDFPAVMERMRRLRAGISPHDSARRFRELGIDVYVGQARFAGPDTVEVAGRSLRFKKAVLATGARAHRPAIPGLAEAGFLTNETVFSLTELPERLAVIGAGPIGCELAQAFARFGAEVYLLGNHDQILPKEDRAAAERVEKALRRDGIQLVLGCDITRVEPSGKAKIVHLRCGQEERAVTVDAILVGAGRVPNVDGLNLEGVGVVYDPREGVKVNDRLQTTNPRIFAAGDICSAFKFTHAADAMARIVIQNARFLGRARASALTIPWCTYTDPEIAHVGLYEQEANEHGVAYRTFTQELADVDRAILDGEDEGFVKVLVSPKADKILGATIVAAHAGDLISEITLAMVGGVGLATIARTIHPYPTQAEALKKLGDAYNRTRLTPFVKWLFGKWLSWVR